MNARSLVIWGRARPQRLGERAGAGRGPGRRGAGPARRRPHADDRGAVLVRGRRGGVRRRVGAGVTADPWRCEACGTAYDMASCTLEVGLVRLINSPDISFCFFFFFCLFSLSLSLSLFFFFFFFFLDYGRGACMAAERGAALLLSAPMWHCSPLVVPGRSSSPGGLGGLWGAHPGCTHMQALCAVRAQHRVRKSHALTQGYC